MFLSTKNITYQADIYPMSLLALSDDLLFQIFSDPILASRDIVRLLCTSSRTYNVALPLRYRRIVGTFTPVQMPGYFLAWEPPPRLLVLTKHFDDHPERLDWVHEAEYACHVRNYLTIEHVVALILRCSRLKTLKLIANGSYLCQEDPHAKVPEAGTLFLQLPDHCANLSNLRNLTIRDLDITVRQIAELYRIKTLHRLQINQLVRTTREQDYEGVVTDLMSTIYVDHGYVSNLRKLTFLRCSLPVGPGVEYLLRGHPNLEEFTWIIDSLDENHQLGPEKLSRGIFSTLRPLHSLLLDLRLSNEHPRRWGSRPFTAQVDLSAFTRLKTLEIDQCLILTQSYSTTTSPSLRRDGLSLLKNLPSSLVYLKMLFLDNTYVYYLFSHKSSLDLHWILVLANSKANYLRNLKQVCLMEREGIDVKTPFSVSEARLNFHEDPEVPIDVSAAFEANNIILTSLARNIEE